MKSFILRIAATLVATFPRLFGVFTLGFGRIGSWYTSNGTYTYPVGTKIAIRYRGIIGFGIRATGVVVEYASDGSRGDVYVIDMTKDVSGDWNEWFRLGDAYPEAPRHTVRERHFKWNIENHFRAVPKTDDAQPVPLTG